MQNIDPALIEEFLRRSNENTDSSAPTVSLLPESFINTLSLGFFVLTVISAMFLIIYLFSVIRKWRVQSAVLHMQKDIAEIKTALVKDSPSASKIDKDSQKIA